MAEHDESPTTTAVRDAVDVKDDVDGRATKKAQDEEFKDQQQALAAAQGATGENVVPEQRPIASQQTLDNYHQSPLYNDLKEAGEINEEPMDRAAYEKASSDSQMSKAEKASVPERLWEGQRVKVLKEPYVKHGAVGHIERVQFKDFGEQQKATSGDPAHSRFAEVESYIVRLRGGRPEILDLQPDEVRVLGGADMGRTET